ncbi:uncharacterized protein LOC135202690 [Macrobrachium nipponense]|uniref:uncharacterized protein LOC135202690 n=1 Tax=Macrobrachium nipponense TaxID=159736 RepID=UPI0030C8ADE5
MRCMVFLCLLAVALALPVAEPEADPQFLLPHSLNYFNPFVHSINAGDSHLYSYPYGHHLAYGHRYPLAYGHGYPLTHGYGAAYPLGYPYSYPVVKKAATEE